METKKKSCWMMKLFWWFRLIWWDTLNPCHWRCHLCWRMNNPWLKMTIVPFDFSLMRVIASEKTNKNSRKSNSEMRRMNFWWVKNNKFYSLNMNFKIKLYSIKNSDVWFFLLIFSKLSWEQEIIEIWLQSQWLVFYTFRFVVKEVNQWNLVY